MSIDPVCGMTVDEKDAAATSKYNGTTVYFCAEACKQKFDAEPEKYLHKSEVCEVDSKDSELSEMSVSISGEMMERGQAKLIVPIQGMSCASCVENIEKGLPQP